MDQTYFERVKPLCIIHLAVFCGMCNPRTTREILNDSSNEQASFSIKWLRTPARGISFYVPVRLVLQNFLQKDRGERI
jgi:hypothetical protein